MAGFANYDAIINALSQGNAQRPAIAKATFPTLSGGKFDMWYATGTPPTGVWGVALTSNLITSATTGALPFTDPGGANTMHLLSVGLGSTVAAGVYVLVDRLLEVPFDGTAVAGIDPSWADVDGGAGTQIPARDAAGGQNGVGVFMFVETLAATINAARTINIEYTNQAGVGGRLTGAVSLFANATAKRLIVDSTLWCPLQAGDTGVQSVQHYMLSASITSTQCNIVLCRPLAFIPVLLANSWTERDMVLQLAGLPQLYDGTALQLLLIAGTTTCPTFGEVVFAEG